MITEERVFVAGAGPVGLVAAAALVRRGIPVTVFEASPALSCESRASTFHPSTLDMLDDLGVADALVATGLVAPRLQYRTRRDGVIAGFDFSGIADVTRHPYRLQSEQHNLTRIIDGALRPEPNYRIEFDRRVCAARQDADGVAVTLAAPDGTTEERRGRWLIGADGARSEVRKALGVEFEGFTWPERFLVIGTTFDFYAVVPGLDAVSYVADPTQWHFYLQIPSMWRLMFPIAPDVSDETATDREFARRTLATVQPTVSDDDIVHVTLYRVHQRVAKSFRLGRAFLVGDAAHINNPLGGMGMNGGIHDAVNLTERLARVWHGEAGTRELDRYDRQRRLVTLEYVQKHSIQNKRNLEASDPAEQARFRDELTKIAISGCARECAEARSKDVGVIATEKGWNLYVGGNGGMSPRHARLLASDLDTETLVRYVDRFLMYYIRTADRLQRTAPWVESLEGGLDHVREVVCEDSLGLADEFEAAMERHVENYKCEWKGVLEDPDKLSRFVSFVNAPDTVDSTVTFTERAGRKVPVPIGMPRVRS